MPTSPSFAETVDEGGETRRMGFRGVGSAREAGVGGIDETFCEVGFV